MAYKRLIVACTAGLLISMVSCKKERETPYNSYIYPRFKVSDTLKLTIEHCFQIL